MLNRKADTTKNAGEDQALDDETFSGVMKDAVAQLVSNDSFHFVFRQCRYQCICEQDSPARADTRDEGIRRSSPGRDTPFKYWTHGDSRLCGQANEAISKQLIAKW